MILKSLKKTTGFIAGKEMLDKKLTFWTVTLWESEGAMKFFRNNGPHKTAMPKLPNWSDEAAVGHWLQDEAVIPDWKTIHENLLKYGRPTKLKRASAQNDTMDFPPPAWTHAERPF